jgi:PAS domain-containing protein
LLEHGALRVVAASDAALLGTRVDLDRPDAALAARLERAAMVRVTATQARLLGLPWEAGTVVPLLIDGALRGVIIIEGFDRSLRDALMTLATQVSLALSRVDAAAAINAREARFHSLLANASEVIGVLDRHGEILYQSEGLTHMLGPAPADVIGHKRHAVRPPGRRARGPRRVRRRRRRRGRDPRPSSCGCVTPTAPGGISKR